MKLIILSLCFVFSWGAFAQGFKTANELKLVQVNKEHLRQKDEKAYFSSIYLVVTRALNQKIKSNSFKNSHCIELMKERFLDMYFEALKSKNAPGPWREALQFNGKPTTHLLLGMNAHITYDLPLSMDHVSYKNPVCTIEEMREDYFSLNSFFAELTPELNQTLKVIATNLTAKAKRFDKLKKSVISGFIVKMRRGAWNNFVKLNRAESRKDYLKRLKQIERSSTQRAKQYIAINPLLPYAGY